MTRRLAAGTAGAVVVCTALLVGAAACGSAPTPAPPMVQQPTNALVEVPYPPPPARVENLPDPPKEDAVWIDGEWVWQGGRWSWRAGRWVVVPPGVAFAPWTTVRSSNGTLYVAEGTFRDAKGKPVPAPQPLATGRPRAGNVVDPEGETVAPSPPAPSAPTTPAAMPPVPGDETPTTAAGKAGASGAFVDAGLKPPPDGRSFPDAGPLPRDAATFPDAFFRPHDASGFDLDAMPLPGARGREMLGMVAAP